MQMRELKRAPSRPWHGRFNPKLPAKRGNKDPTLDPPHSNTVSAALSLAGVSIKAMESVLRWLEGLEAEGTELQLRKWLCREAVHARDSLKSVKSVKLRALAPFYGLLDRILTWAPKDAHDPITWAREIPKRLSEREESVELRGGSIRCRASHR